LRRSVIFVDSAGRIVKSYQHRGKSVYTGAMIGVGMRQCDLVSAAAPASRDGGPGLPAAPGGSGLLAAGLGSSKTDALVALFPDFTIGRRLPDLAATRLSGVVSWCDLRRQGAARGRAAELGAPFLRFGPGLLWAPPGWGPAAPILSVTVHEITGPGSAADMLSPDRLLASSGWESPGLLARAADLRRQVVARRLGGAWWNSGAESRLPHAGSYGLILGETSRDSAEGSTSLELLNAMLAAAKAENASQQTVLAVPGQAGRRRLPASFLREAAACGGTVLTGTVDLWEAIARAETVYTTGGDAGFLALLAGAKVRCFANSFYSGWGITTDQPSVPLKPLRRTVDEVFAGACLLGTRYLDPYRRAGASFEEILEVLADWQKIDAVNRTVAVCLGMSFWKRRHVRDFLRSSAGAPAFRRTKNAGLAAARRRPGSSIAVWASRAPAGLAEAAEQSGVPLIRVEDGFIRSVGLGSDFIPAASLALDSRSMHFDPSVRSDLEQILAETEFDAALTERARNLITRLVARGITKYNVGDTALPVEWPSGRRRILVPGQVEDDLSVRLGGEGIKGNLDLLARVRSASPDAFILYKPHPDVEAGHREGKIDDRVAGSFADVVIRDISTAVVLTEIDEVHTLTSLAGFEALLRGRRVVVYGRPFYAGWGLTSDLAGIDRGRRLTLEELVAGALILYPRYLDPVTRLPCEPELVIERLATPELWRPGLLVAARRLQGSLMRRWSETLVRSARLLAKAAPSAR
jgi:capsular polysaccharide export protein